MRKSSRKYTLLLLIIVFSQFSATWRPGSRVNKQPASSSTHLSQRITQRENLKWSNRVAEESWKFTYLPLACDQALLAIDWTAKPITLHFILLHENSRCWTWVFVSSAYHYSPQSSPSTRQTLSGDFLTQRCQFIRAGHQWEQLEDTRVRQATEGRENSFTFSTGLVVLVTFFAWQLFFSVPWRDSQYLLRRHLAELHFCYTLSLIFRDNYWKHFRGLIGLSMACR